MGWRSGWLAVGILALCLVTAACGDAASSTDDSQSTSYASGLELAAVLEPVEPACADATIEEIDDQELVEMLGLVEFVECPSFQGAVSNIVLLDSADSRIRTAAWTTWYGCFVAGTEHAHYVYGENWMVEISDDWLDPFGEIVAETAGGALNSVDCDAYGARLLEVVGDYAPPPATVPTGVVASMLGEAQ